MKIFKRLMSVLMGILCVLTMVMSVNAEDVEPEIIYRESFQKYGKDYVGKEYLIGYSVIAKSNGEIKIVFDCISGTGWGYEWRDFGEIRINDTMIAPLNEEGFAGKSSRSGSYSVLESYGLDYTVYTLTTTSSFSSGKHIDIFYFYVKEHYLHTEQVINVCGTEIIIPFGDEIPSTEQSQMIHELESQINDLNSEIERLKSELEISHQNEANLIEDIDYLYADIDTLMARRGDINDDGQYTVADVVLLARYVAGTIDTIPYVPGGD